MSTKKKRKTGRQAIEWACGSCDLRMIIMYLANKDTDASDVSPRLLAAWEAFRATVEPAVAKLEKALAKEKK